MYSVIVITEIVVCTVSLRVTSALATCVHSNNIIGKKYEVKNMLWSYQFYFTAVIELISSVI